MALNLQLAMPIMAPLSQDREECQLHTDCLAELADVNGGLRPLDPSFGGSLIQIRVVGNPADEPLLRDLWQVPLKFRDYSLLVFEIDGQACAENIRLSSEVPAERFTAAEAESLSHQEALTCLEFEASSLLLVANILRPGSLSAVEGYAFVDGEQGGQTKPYFAEHLFGAVRASRELGWPRLFKPTLQQTWKWLVRSGALIDGIGVGRLGRAIAALSHLTTPNLLQTSSIDLVWVLLGLEALYSKGNVGLKEQLLGKTEAILGPRTENKRAFGAVYDFRSRLLHGDVDLPLRFTEFDAVKKFEDFHEELSRSEDLALATLIATLQWMAEKGATELDFDYTLKASASDQLGAT